MTLHEVAHQVYTLAKPLPCYINGVKRGSEAEVRKLLACWLRNAHDNYICEICLPDGRWNMRLSRDGRFYDYYIPETRDQEKRLVNKLLEGRNA